MNVSEVKRADALVRELEWLEGNGSTALKVTEINVYGEGDRGLNTSALRRDLERQIQAAASSLILTALNNRKDKIVAELKALGVDPSMPGNCDD